MEIEIQSKTNNPLLKRTEVHFIIRHENEGTPKRELVRTELADQLKVKKENIMVNVMESSFGKAETVGYAKIYQSLKQAEENEQDHILKRNQGSGKKQAKPAADAATPPPTEQPAEQPEPVKEPEQKQSTEEPSSPQAQAPAQPTEPQEPAQEKQKEKTTEEKEKKEK